MITYDYNRGDVVLVNFPYSDLIRYKQRPALVVQDITVYTGLMDLLIAQITSNTDRKGPSRVSIEKNSIEGKQMGVLADSVIMADKIATISSEMINKKIGSCPCMENVEKALKVILGLK